MAQTMAEADGRAQAAFVDYGSAFAHYPTQLLTADCQVAVTGSGHSLSAPALEMTRAAGLVLVDASHEDYRERGGGR